MKIDIDNQNDLNEKNLQNVDVAIEFTIPEIAVDNYKKCFAAKIPVVSGTTGWLDRFSEIELMCKNHENSFFYASNFSLGVNIFFKLNTFLARIMNQHKDYEVAMSETHHTQKLDAPSGTAITLAEGVLRQIDRKEQWKLNSPSSKNIIGIEAIRRGNVPGIHTITYDSEVDIIQITHDAKSRQGFAKGAVLAAEFMKEKTSGIYGMDDLLQM